MEDRNSAPLQRATWADEYPLRPRVAGLVDWFRVGPLLFNLLLWAAILAPAVGWWLQRRHPY